MVELYGGAVTTTLPVGIVDVSDMRQVPDNQEVFIIEEGDKDISIIFDLLEQVDAQDINTALKMHIDDMLETNQFTMIEEIALKFLDTKIHTCYVNSNNSIHLISLIRLSKVETDIVISMHVASSDINFVKDKYYGVFKAAGQNYNIKNWDLFN
ncbi:uncharacterized protein AC631_01374 [Debaryomyces fabryi]|uniref:Uncharacterized protein n=1 Tax=Debaryomyces fabryi TaxID=58627 RepID=A0A0V1Q2Y7_9ASCO|nr:uncharacterized protein AC631_01374 [Debaryomyces fabryi]KSA02894.1 hypothetical protein AC631_01374 [Debaryomyces fabryi]CUM45032.1 unnamed protein product [Debaryomyces fabryi]